MVGLGMLKNSGKDDSGRNSANRGSGSRGSGSRSSVRKRDVASYMLLPKILPRIGDLFFTGFDFFAFFMAQVYRSVRLLPADHPSLNPANVGEYGIRDIIGEAWHHLVWKRENIDQILVFMAILVGLVILLLQAATFVVAFAMPQAMAAGNPSGGFSSIFGVPYGGGTQDIAFILMDRVFGVPGIFNSCVSDSSTPCFGAKPGDMSFSTDPSTAIYKPPVFPWPFHQGLHAMFQFYSMGLLLVGVFILLYYVVVIVAETAQTGTPFGKRFNTVWAPLRLVMAFGLLIPITNGLNSAQYITLYAAKWGSNFATNGWIVFNKAIDGSMDNMDQGMQFAVKPKEPDIAGLLNFMQLAHTCKVFSETTMSTAPALSQPANTACSASAKGTKIEAYVVKAGYDKNNTRKILGSLNYNEALAFAENGDIQVRFGDETCNGANTAGNIAPVCGQITIPTNSATDKAAKEVQEGYFNLIQYMWGGYTDGANGETRSYQNTTTTDTRVQAGACLQEAKNGLKGYNWVLGSTGDQNLKKYALYKAQEKLCIKNNTDNDPNKDYTLLSPPPVGWEAAAVQSYMYGNDPDGNESDIDTDVTSLPEYPVWDRIILRNILKRGVRTLRQSVSAGEYSVSDDNLRRGWAVAGIWYNKIAEANGSLIGAAWDLPAPDSYPQIMAETASAKAQVNNSNSTQDMFCPDLPNGNMSLPQGSAGMDYARVMCTVYKNGVQARLIKPTGNAFSDVINYIFGIQGLFDLRYQQNNRAHPLAMLVGVGKSLIEASIRNLAIGLGSGLLGILAGLAAGGQAAELTGAISSFMFSIATMTLTAGFVLYYVIPFLPFLYFFFAVGNWLKGVFEAMVGVPLWALAHLRIDGNGLPGEGAMNGYFMLFEIFLRPILIVFGFLASITIFAAMASVLHEVFEVAVSNLTGAGTANGSSGIDKFFYTIMYAVIMYMMALSSFKLIDLVPKQIMRWMGTSVSTFSDLSENAADNLTQMTAIAGSQVVGGMTQGLQQFTQATGKAAGSIHDAGKAATSRAMNQATNGGQQR